MYDYCDISPQFFCQMSSVQKSIKFKLIIPEIFIKYILPVIINNSNLFASLYKYYSLTI